MGNVYVLNKGYHNYAEAGKYGKSVFVTEGPRFHSEATGVDQTTVSLAIDP